MMDDTATIAAARSFLTLLDGGPTPSSRELLRSLDELAMAYHHTPEGDPSEDEATPPTRDYQQRRASLGKRFPSYGYYTLWDPTEPVDDKELVGDAIDDLADIAADLEQVLWRFENLGADDAHWYYRFLFEIHWGMHLRELALYLHANALRSSKEN